jgi:AraC-like DNA-binding protein
MVPQLGQTSLSFSSFIILLGVVQGILLTITGLFQPERKAKLKALLFFSITCIIAEIFLNRTGYMDYVIQMVDFSEPFQFAIPPLSYLIVIGLSPENRMKRWWLHFIPFFAYLIFFLPYYFAPISFKRESYYFMHHMVAWHSSENFEIYRTLGKYRTFLLQANYLQMTIYVVLGFQLLMQYKKTAKEKPDINKFEVNWWIMFNVAAAMLIVLILVVKETYFRDLGDHIIAAFFTFLLYLSTITELIKSAHSGKSVREKDNLVQDESPRNSNSGIKEEKKLEIQEKLIVLMEQKKLFTDSLISIASISKQTGEPAYVVSQVINEKMGLSFYDWIARYRVEESKKLLTDPKTERYTIEQIAEEVGYNSKSAFNKAFKKFTGKTPSEFKNN